MAEQGGEEKQVTPKVVLFSVSVPAVVTNKVETPIWRLSRRIPHLHPVSVRRFPSFRTQPLKNLSHYLWKEGLLSNPAPGENILSGNLVKETGRRNNHDDNDNNSNINNSNNSNTNNSNTNNNSNASKPPRRAPQGALDGGLHLGRRRLQPAGLPVQPERALQECVYIYIYIHVYITHMMSCNNI